jgi:NTP pyrophosphatase (non-canonical NTP hydrolase)
MLDFDMYQSRAKETAIYPGRGKLLGLLYATIGLTGEAGELANKVKKILRDSNGSITDETKEAIAGEIGDTLWYCATICDELDLRMAKVANDNIIKLANRKFLGKISGEGDKR